MATDAAPSLTEQHNPRSADMDALCAADLVRLFAEEDRRAVEATVAVADDTARAVEWAASSMRAGGRLLYVGAGTSGRLGVLRVRMPADVWCRRVDGGRDNRRRRRRAPHIGGGRRG